MTPSDSTTLREPPAPSDAATVSVGGSRREQAKDERRARIVTATCDLLREVGIDGLSGKLIAARADVSLSTVYNLFGSKQAVLARVFDLDLLNYERRVAALPSSDGLERMFDAVDVAGDLYAADPAFYRATLWRRPASEFASNAALRGPRIRFWRGLVQAAIDEGRLRPDTDAAALGALMIRIMSAVLADWIAGELSIDQLRAETKFGFAAAVSAFADEACRPAIERRIREHSGGRGDGG